MSNQLLSVPVRNVPMDVHTTINRELIYGRLFAIDTGDNVILVRVATAEQLL